MSFPYPVYPLSNHTNAMRMIFENEVNAFLYIFDEDEQPQYYLPYLYSDALGFDFPDDEMYFEFQMFRGNLRKFWDQYAMTNGMSHQEYYNTVEYLRDYYHILDCSTGENRDYVMYCAQQHMLNRDWVLRNAHLAHEVM